MGSPACSLGFALQLGIIVYPFIGLPLYELHCEFAFFMPCCVVPYHAMPMSSSSSFRHAPINGSIPPGVYLVASESTDRPQELKHKKASGGGVEEYID